MSRELIQWGAIALALGAVAIGAAQVNAWHDQARAARACTAAVTLGRGDPATACPPAIAADHAVAIRARACDAALDATPENTFGVAASCSAPGKRVVAERDVARREAGRLTETLTTERLGQDAAIARAQAAATTQAERKARAVAALEAAPRDGDGLAVCDAQCVHDRWSDADASRP